MYDNNAITYLPIDSIVVERESDFSPLGEKEFGNLVESIRRIGVRQPIIVYPTADNNGKYVIHAGYNRLRAVKSIGLTHIPCLIATDRVHAIDIRFDTDLYRRHLTDREIAKYEEIKQERQKEHLKSVVIPELYSMYEEGILSMNFLMRAANFLPEHQAELIPIVELRKDAEISDIIAAYEQRIAELEEKIKTMEQESESIKKLQGKIEEKLKAKEAEIARVVEEKYRGESVERIRIAMEEERARIQAEVEAMYKEEMDDLLQKLRDATRNKADLQQLVDSFKEEIQRIKNENQAQLAINQKTKDELAVTKKVVEKLLNSNITPMKLEILVKEALNFYEAIILTGIEAFENNRKAMAEKAAQLQDIAIGMIQFFESGSQQ